MNCIIVLSQCVPFGSARIGQSAIRGTFSQQCRSQKKTQETRFKILLCKKHHSRCHPKNSTKASKRPPAVPADRLVKAPPPRPRTASQTRAPTARAWRRRSRGHRRPPVVPRRPGYVDAGTRSARRTNLAKKSPAVIVPAPTPPLAPMLFTPASALSSDDTYEQ